MIKLLKNLSKKDILIIWKDIKMSSVNLISNQTSKAFVAQADQDGNKTKKVAVSLPLPSRGYI